ncbi:hypothetical protein [Pseudomonas bohemica]|uniref:hypothetical protein n=1 Tax=Pseudomonas bohemica TaxID=2044872 RepID=UPI000DA625EF|nr:hypothetical protein [Pseudomonas bohemica]
MYRANGGLLISSYARIEIFTVSLGRTRGGRTCTCLGDIWRTRAKEPRQPETQCNAARYKKGRIVPGQASHLLEQFISAFTPQAPGEVPEAVCHVSDVMRKPKSVFVLQLLGCCSSTSSQIFYLISGALTILFQMFSALLTRRLEKSFGVILQTMKRIVWRR